MKTKILSALKSKNDYVSGEELSSQLGITRSAVWKNINLLKKEGYMIDSVRNRGYKLEKCPDIIDAEAVRAKLNVKNISKSD